MSRPENPLRRGLAEDRTVDPCTVVIFGASGDLTKRKLMPGLYNLAVSRALSGFAEMSYRADAIHGGPPEIWYGWMRHARTMTSFNVMLVMLTVPPGVVRMNMPRASGAAGLIEETSNCGFVSSWVINSSKAARARSVYMLKFDA